MGVYEIGTRPTNVKIVPPSTEVEQGRIYGADITGEVWSYLPPGTFEEKMAEQWWNKIKEKGDQPLYVRVEAKDVDYSGGIMVRYKYKVNITIFARKGSDPINIVQLIAAIAALIFSIGWLIDKVDEWRYNTWYYETYGRPPEKREELLAGLETLLLLIVILYILSILSKRR